jgi:hypothetical protein
LRKEGSIKGGKAVDWEAHFKKHPALVNCTMRYLPNTRSVEDWLRGYYSDLSGILHERRSPHDYESSSEEIRIPENIFPSRENRLGIGCLLQYHGFPVKFVPPTEDFEPPLERVWDDITPFPEL